MAILRSSQIFGGKVNGVLGLRAALGLPDGAPTAEVDALEARAGRRGVGPRLRKWMPWRLGRARWSWHSQPPAGWLMPSRGLWTASPKRSTRLLLRCLASRAERVSRLCA